MQKIHNDRFKLVIFRFLTGLQGQLITNLCLDTDGYHKGRDIHSLIVKDDISRK